jgi:acetyl-CoA C-acetyltransferase/acetyl-CoA acyltransferase
MHEPLIQEALRTPFGRRGGALRETRPDSLLAGLLQALCARSGLAPGHVDDVICGCVTQAGEQAANVGRLAVLLAGFPPDVPGISLNRMCGSGQQAVHFAAQAIAAGDARFVIGAGVESMSRVPMFLDLTLGGEYRGFERLNPALFERWPLIHQVESAERLAEKWGIGRSELDEWARTSHARAQAAPETRGDIVPTAGLDPDGQPLLLMRDEGVRALWDAARAAALPPVLRAPGAGVVTAANSSQLSDGAGAVLVGDRDAARALGLRPRARFLARVAVGSDPTLQLDGVIPAMRLALRRAGLTLRNIDWIEINEAFASVVLAWAREFDPDMSRVNPWGGAIAHGHPLGATGAGLMAKMVSGLEITGGSLGLQALCIGHGMATCTIVERV